MNRTSVVVWGAAMAGAILAIASCAPGNRIVSTTSTGTGGGTGVGPGAGGSSVGGAPATASASSTSASSGSSSSGADAHCAPPSSDYEGCPCSASDAPRVCWPASANPKNRNVGTCKDGAQTCTASGEFASWGACTGSIGPVAEVCDDGLDNDCNELADCTDPSCAGDPGCSGGCTDGMTRPCYDGPPGTVSVGTCKPGTQTCVNGAWPTTCPGEVTPQTEVCSDFLDHNCNGFPGCFDFLVCFTDPACQPVCNPPAGCTCPMGVGDNAVCPNGDYGDPYSGACCPCTTGTCDQIGCCGEAVCAGSPVCSGLTCAPLPASCGGMVNQDCDWEDLSTSDAQNPPEDCDMVCCKCRPNICP